MLPAVRRYKLQSGQGLQKLIDFIVERGMRGSVHAWAVT